MNRYLWRQELYPGSRSAYWLRVAFRLCFGTAVATMVVLTLLVLV